MSNILDRRHVRGSMLAVDNLYGTAFTGEENAHVFRITDYEGSAAVAFTGEIAGKFINPAGVTVPLSGSLDGDGRAVVTLDEHCYAVEGRFILTIWADSEVIYCGVGQVMNSQTDTIDYPTAGIPDVAALIQQLQTILNNWPADYSQLQSDVSNLKSALTETVECVGVTPTINNEFTGVTCVYESQNVLKVYGTSTAARRVLCLNGQNAIKTSSGSFSKTFEAGTYEFSTSVSGYLSTNDYSWQYTNTTYANAVTAVTQAVPVKTVTLTQPVMFGLAFGSGVNFGTADNPTYITINAKRTIPHDWLSPVDTNTSDETGKTDMKQLIESALKTNGYCRLGTGIFYVSGIEMPEGSTLCGCGKGTIIRLLQSVTTGCAVKMSMLNVLSDVCVSGGYSAPTITSQGTRSGIMFVADHDGTDTGTAYDAERCLISNVWVENFTDSGIKCHNTGISFRKGLYATNVMCAVCWCGINIDYYSEFNKFTNALTSLCYIGCINNGGNNVFTACTFHGSTIGFKVDGTQPNSAHGTVNGCTFCHAGSNSGSAITMDGVDNGFVISDSQIWYNSIDLTNCSGIVFSGCEFGRTTNSGVPINISGGNTIIFNGCMFMLDSTYTPSINITNNTKVKFDACYGSESGNLVVG